MGIDIFCMMDEPLSNPRHNKNSTRWSVIIALLISLLPLFVHADVWKLHVTLETEGLFKYTARFTEWDFSSTMPNPLYGCNGQSPCTLALVITKNNSVFPGTEILNAEDVSSAKTMGELGLVIQRTGLWFGKTHTSQAMQSRTECVSATFLHVSGSYMTLPGGQCTYGEVPPNNLLF